jgi:hypothetical protein
MKSIVKTWSGLGLEAKGSLETTVRDDRNKSEKRRD